MKSVLRRSPRLRLWMPLILLLSLSMIACQSQQSSPVRTQPSPTGRPSPPLQFPPPGQPTPIPTAASGKTYYVSKNGNDADGRSWSTAWNELDAVNWAVIQPGDTILLDGGAAQMVYTTTLTIGKSGTPNAPITIRRATEAGRNGKVVIFGGRSMPLPYCGQKTYTNQTAGVTITGIEFGASSWVTVDGMSWGGISDYAHSANGVDFSTSADHDTLRNMEIYDNGHAYQQSDGTWEPNTRGDGVNLFGSNLTFEQMDIHDNGDDALEGGYISNITILHSWLHETREDPTQQGLPFDQCVHQDGIQVWGGGVQSGVLIEDSVLGPGLKEGTIIGQSPVGASPGAVVNNVTIRNTLFLNKVINVMGYSYLKEYHWTLDHDTIVSPGNAIAIWVEGSGHAVTNSIFYGGQILLPDGLSASSGNCQWRANHGTTAVGGITADPEFVTDASSFGDSTPLAQLAAGNYSLRPGSPCAGKGTSITSVAQLIASANQP